MVLSIQPHTPTTHIHGSLRFAVCGLRSEGFTLVELLIAATMMAVLFVGLGAHLRGGITVWRRATASEQTLQRRRVALDRLGRELADALIYDGRRDTYEPDGRLAAPQFSAAQLRWFTLAPTGRRQPAAVRFVTYACERHDGVKGLWRTSQSVDAWRSRQPAAPELLLTGCDQLTIRYAIQRLPDQPASDGDPVAWRATWDDSITTLPRLLAVSLKLDTGEDLTRVFAIPAGKLPSEPMPAA